MTTVNKNILRVILISSYIAILAFIIFGISSLYAYLNTGANRSSMLHTSIKKTERYVPKTTWNTKGAKGRIIDKETLKNVEKNYLEAWYVKNICFKTNTKHGIQDYYTKDARKNITNTINYNKKHNIYVEQTTLKHNLTVNFFSEDGKLIVLTDSNVIDYQRVYKNETIKLERQNITTYKIIMLLEDGYWRIRHLIQEDSKKYKPNISTAHNNLASIKGINYYPQETPWDMFGAKFNTNTIRNDFKIIKKSGLNSIRIFIPYQDFGANHVKIAKLKKLNILLNLAKLEKLKVVVTLFDFYGDYSVINWTLNRKHANSIVSHIKNHDALLAWDIKNEPNLDFKSRGKHNVLAWLINMTKFIKTIDKKHPVTIGWSNASSANILKEHLDFISFHYYDDINNLEITYNKLKQKINKPIVITEFGMSTYIGIWNPFGHTERDQLQYFKKAQSIFNKNKINFMSWTLYDFYKTPKEVAGRLPWRKETQGKYGLINHNRETKPAFKYISSM